MTGFLGPDRAVRLGTDGQPLPPTSGKAGGKGMSINRNQAMVFGAIGVGVIAFLAHSQNQATSTAASTQPAVDDTTDADVQGLDQDVQNLNGQLTALANAPGTTPKPTVTTPAKVTTPAPRPKSKPAPKPKKPAAKKPRAKKPAPVKKPAAKPAAAKKPAIRLPGRKKPDPHGAAAKATVVKPRTPVRKPVNSRTVST